MTVQSSSILIVDDEETNSEGCAAALQKHDYAVTVAKCGATSSRVLGKLRFDLVLLDIMMPGMNGLKYQKLLRRVES